MRTRPLTKREKDVIGSELDNASMADCHNEKTSELINLFSTLVYQDRLRVVIDKPTKPRAKVAVAALAPQGEPAVVWSEKYVPEYLYCTHVADGRACREYAVVVEIRDESLTGEARCEEHRP